MAATALNLGSSTNPGRRTERVIKIRPLDVSLDVADAILALLHELAEERVVQEMEQRLRSLYQTNRQAATQIDLGAADENGFVARNVNNAQLRAAAQIGSHEKYTFLSPTSHVQFESPDFDAKDLPKDINLVKAYSEGVNGRFIDIQIRSQFKDFNEVRNWQLNQIVIHGDSSDWVNAIHERLSAMLNAQVLKTRAFIYGNCLVLFWISVVLVFLPSIEYRNFSIPVSAYPLPYQAQVHWSCSAF